MLEGDRACMVNRKWAALLLSAWISYLYILLVLAVTLNKILKKLHAKLSPPDPVVKTTMSIVSSLRGRFTTRGVIRPRKPALTHSVMLLNWWPASSSVRFWLWGQARTGHRTRAFPICARWRYHCCLPGCSVSAGAAPREERQHRSVATEHLRLAKQK